MTTLYLITLRHSIICFLTLALQPWELGFNALETELIRRGVEL